MPPFISLLTDFGPDGPAAICRGVMLTIAPDARILDIGHGIRKYAIADGAYLMSSAVPYIPTGVHVGVVDPGVGTERLPIGIRTARGDYLIGPDNGLLLPAAEALGGAVEARVLENRDFMLPKTSSTFHGRDIFSPMGAHLAMGVPFSAVGAEIAVGRLEQLREPRPEVGDGELRTSVIYVDSFGNVRLAAQPDDLAAAIGPLEGGRGVVVEFDGGGPEVTERTTWQPTFGRVPVGTSLLFEDSLGRVALADNQGDAAGRLGVAVGRRVRVRPA